MTTYDLRKKTNASTGQRVIPSDNNLRVDYLENKINDQEKKLDRILELLQNGNNLPNTDK
jgi:hypothetical protein